MICYKNARIILNDQILENHSLFVEEDRIVSIVSEGDSHHYKADKIIDCQKHYISAGWIDLHIHGGGGADYMDLDSHKFRTIGKAHAAHGMTSCLATTLASQNEEVFKLLNDIPDENEALGGTRILGVHLEGPYFAMEQRGAQDPKYIRKPTKTEIDLFLSHSNRIVRWSMAPELEGMSELGPDLKKRGLLLSIAHTNANAKDVLNAEKIGFDLVTHLYSGMSTLSRVNGIRVAGAVEGVYISKHLSAELIADGKHLPLEILNIAYKLLGPHRLLFTTDAMRAAGTTVSHSILGSLDQGQPVIIKDGVAKLPDESSLAGSVATMDRLIQNALKAEIPLCDAIRAVTVNPAKLIHRYPEYGTLEAHSKADFVIFDESINIIETVINGHTVYKRGSNEA